MSSNSYWPIIIPLPIDVSQRVELLHTLFSSKVITEVLKLFTLEGTVCQRDVINALHHHSNKTVIDALRRLVKLGIIEEVLMYEKRGSRRVRLKCYKLTDLGRWFYLMLRGPENIDKATLKHVVEGLFGEIISRISYHEQSIGIGVPDLIRVFCRRVIDAVVQRSKRKCRAAVLGSVAVDHYVELEPSINGSLTYSRYLGLFHGGNGANVATVLRRFGTDVGFYGKIAADFYGASLTYGMVSEGIDMSSVEVDENAITIETLVVVRRGRESKIICMISDRSALSPLHLSENGRRLIDEAEAVYVGEVFHEVAEEALSITQEKDSISIFRPNTRALELMSSRYLSLLRFNPILVLNAEKMQILIRQCIDVLKLLDLGAKYVIVTLGPQGAVLYGRGKRVRYTAPRMEVIDTAGAGDSFSATLLYSLMKGYDIETAVRLSVLAGSLSVTQLGPRWSPPKFETIEKNMNIVKMEVLS